VTEQDLLARVREQAEALEEAAAEDVWAEIARGQDPVEIVFARNAATEYSISWEYRVI